MLGARDRFVKRRELKLQLTSLLDMFTIILVFLMVSFQAADKDFVLKSGLDLPVSAAKSPFKTAVNIAITLDGVYVDGVKVHPLDEGDVSDEDFESGKVESIKVAVEQAWDRSAKEDWEENVVVIQADKGLPYRTIHLVMRSAAHAGFFRYRLVIEKE